MYLNTRSSSQSNGDGGAGDATHALGLLAQSMATADSYPTNIAYSRNYDYQLKEYARQLYDDRAKLFGNSNLVDILEFREGTGGTGKFDNSLQDYLKQLSHSL